LNRLTQPESLAGDAGPSFLAHAGAAKAAATMSADKSEQRFVPMAFLSAGDA
jgi:hypothetical protein